MAKLFADIEIDKNTSAKLKAISKHTAALADELDQIDADTCPECGELCEVMEVHADNTPQYKFYACNECGYETRG